MMESTKEQGMREAFEKFVSEPPFEYSIERQPENGCWPGNYRSIAVQLAWEAWQAALATVAPAHQSEAVAEAGVPGRRIHKWFVNVPTGTLLYTAPPSVEALTGLCPMCGNTGRYPVGNSGSDSDGNTTEFEDCECDYSLTVRENSQLRVEVERLTKELLNAHS
jgi:hypothetical protein